MQRPNLFGKSIALNGDKTSTGATCIATIQQVTCYGHSVLRVGDPTTTCPQCGKPGIIITGEDRINNHGKIQAVHNSIVQCGCPLSSNFVIAVTSKKPSNHISNSLTNLIPALFSQKFILKNKDNPTAYGIKTASGFIEGISKKNGELELIETSQEENIEIVYLFQTRIGTKK
ncbi:PAAR domain-containing protein [Proteus terrae]|uniref:PAAR domain-containing protein n=1 Tax=Proteus terrae TaxID=1574161 RepID=UPI0032DADCBA